jgi:hypothetical protein
MVRDPVHSTLPLLVLVATLAACGDDVAPPPAPAAPPAASPSTDGTAAPATAAAQPADANAPAKAAAAEREREAQRVATTVAELLANAARGDIVAQGKAPETIKALGDAALPGLATGLAQTDVVQRRIAVMTLLQWGKQLPVGSPAIAALDSARKDADPAVAAAAEHAWRRAIGDTSALDRMRAAEEEALRKRR